MEREKLIYETIKLLQEIKFRRPKNFSGIGLVAYNDEFDKNSHCDLRPNKKSNMYYLSDKEFCDYLIDIADYDHCFHDGFHMINQDGKLTHVAQYFVPPVVKGIEPNPDHGVRTYSSICGSTLKGVLFIAAICTNLQIFIFENGKDITEYALRLEREASVNA